MMPGYRWPTGIGVVAVAVLAWAAMVPEASPALLLVAAVAGPLAVAGAVRARLGATKVPVAAFFGGVLVGPLVSLVGAAAVGAFAYAFVLGFADAGRRLLEILRADPRLVDVVSSPWTMLLLIELAAVAPLTEEVGKALGARLEGFAGRRDAFLAGVAAGTGFAIVENLFYAGSAAVFGGPWEAIAVGRLLGVAVHPLASGLVVVGWWEWREHRHPVRLARGFLAGAGVHALWNGSLVGLGIVELAGSFGEITRGLGAVGLGYMAALGAVLAWALWRLAAAVAEDRVPRFELRDVRNVAGWVLLAASMLAPVAILIFAFPDFVGR